MLRKNTSYKKIYMCKGKGWRKNKNKLKFRKVSLETYRLMF